MNSVFVASVPTAIRSRRWSFLNTKEAKSL